MLNFHIGIALFGIFLILLGILHVLQKNRGIYVPEGFTSEYTQQNLSDIKNPILKLIKKIGALTVHFANPVVWKEAYSHSQMSVTDLARKQIAIESKQKEKI
jgi:hypothetical protein